MTEGMESLGPLVHLVLEEGMAEDTDLVLATLRQTVRNPTSAITDPIERKTSVQKDAHIIIITNPIRKSPHQVPRVTRGIIHTISLIITSLVRIAAIRINIDINVRIITTILAPAAIQIDTNVPIIIRNPITGAIRAIRAIMAVDEIDFIETTLQPPGATHPPLQAPKNITPEECRLRAIVRSIDIVAGDTDITIPARILPTMKVRRITSVPQVLHTVATANRTALQTIAGSTETGGREESMERGEEGRHITEALRGRSPV